MARKWKVYKTPVKEGDEPVQVYTYEPNEVIVQQLAMKHGGVKIVEVDE